MGARPGERAFPAGRSRAGIEVEAHSAYAPGDDLRHLDWNAARPPRHAAHAPLHRRARGGGAPPASTRARRWACPRPTASWTARRELAHRARARSRSRAGTPCGSRCCAAARPRTSLRASPARGPRRDGRAARRAPRRRSGSISARRSATYAPPAPGGRRGARAVRLPGRAGRARARRGARCDARGYAVYLLQRPRPRASSSPRGRSRAACWSTSSPASDTPIALDAEVLARYARAAGRPPGRAAGARRAPRAPRAALVASDTPVLDDRHPRPGPDRAGAGAPMIGLAESRSASLALASVGVLVALTLCARRTRIVPVSSLLLWQQIPARARRAPALPSRPALRAARCSLLLALAIGYLRPYVVRPRAASDGGLAVVLDVSASMQVREADGTRFDLARGRARRARRRAARRDARAARDGGGSPARRAPLDGRPRTPRRAARRRSTPLDTPTALAPAVAARARRGVARGRARASPSSPTSRRRRATCRADGAARGSTGSQIGAARRQRRRSRGSPSTRRRSATPPTPRRPSSCATSTPYRTPPRSRRASRRHAVAARMRSRCRARGDAARARSERRPVRACSASRLARRRRARRRRRGRRLDAAAPAARRAPGDRVGRARHGIPRAGRRRCPADASRW